MRCKMRGAWLPVLLLAVAEVSADLYLHSPRGSNNRLNEQSAARSNANRLFDSQNNNRGGYNAGDVTDKPAGNQEANQYRMQYFQSSSKVHSSSDDLGATLLTLEWTNQHGCGGDEDSDPHKLNCNMVIQYTCQDDVATPEGDATNKHFVLRNGVKTQQQDYARPASLTETEAAATSRRNKARTDRGLHESYEWYDSCVVRERNNGLFTADQMLKSDNGLGYSSALYTRQNPNGNRNGYECPEERDYYPYWHPTPWRDVAVLAENASMCGHYTEKSFNAQPYHECVEYWTDDKRKPYSRWNNAKDCVDNGGQWVALYNYLEKAPGFPNERRCVGASKEGVRYIWEVPFDSADAKTRECLVALDKPLCQQAPWTRSNHLGNGRQGEPNKFTWTLPYFPSGATKRCVFRMRYNISTDDYDPYHTNSSFNNDKSKGIKSPVQQNPYVDLGVGSSPLRLAINTAQFGRVFQDRSHVFKLVPRPSGVGDKRIHNLNVRGKRGNIVQVYPAVEYDFTHNPLEMSDQDVVHIQWTGSNTHNNGQPEGDGQAGDAGEGTTGTDRSNMVEVADRNGNFPLPFESTTMWAGARVKWIYHGNNDVTPEDLALNLASSGYYECKEGCDKAPSRKRKLDNLLNNAPASYRGVVLQLAKGKYHYICTRNNNFTNRSQKSTIIVL